jgi:hypothetical protein
VFFSDDPRCVGGYDFHLLAEDGAVGFFAAGGQDLHV